MANQTHRQPAQPNGLMPFATLEMRVEGLAFCYDNGIIVSNFGSCEWIFPYDFIFTRCS